jgi:hypothetical protein
LKIVWNSMSTNPVLESFVDIIKSWPMHLDWTINVDIVI